MGPRVELVEGLRVKRRALDGGMDEFVGDEDVGDRVVVAAGSPHPGRGPGVEDLHVGRGQHTVSIHRPAVRTEPRRVAVVHVTAQVHPARDEDVAALRPAPGEAIAAAHGHRAPLGRRGAGHDGPARRGEHGPELIVRQRPYRPRHRAGGDQHAPGRRALHPGQRVDHVEVRQGIDLAAAQRAREKHAIEPRVDHRLDERFGEGPAALDRVAGLAQPRLEGAHGGEEIVALVARQRGGRRAVSVGGGAVGRWRRGEMGSHA